MLDHSFQELPKRFVFLFEQYPFRFQLLDSQPQLVPSFFIFAYQGACCRRHTLYHALNVPDRGGDFHSFLTD